MSLMQHDYIIKNEIKSYNEQQFQRNKAWMNSVQGKFQIKLVNSDFLWHN